MEISTQQPEENGELIELVSSPGRAHAGWARQADSLRILPLVHSQEAEKLNLDV